MCVFFPPNAYERVYLLVASQSMLVVVVTERAVTGSRRA